MSARNDILDALLVLLRTTGVTVLRNAALPASVPDDGLILMPDGEPGEPKAFMGRARYLEHYQHTVDVLVFSASATPEAEIYGIADEIAAAVRANRSLGGTVEGTTVGAVTVGPIPVDDGAPMVAGTLPITLHYTLEVAA